MFWSHFAGEPVTGRAAVRDTFAGLFETFEDFARQSEFFVDVASDYKADFLLFPELFTTQLLSTITAERPSIGGTSIVGGGLTEPAGNCRTAVSSSATTASSKPPPIPTTTLARVKWSR